VPVPVAEPTVPAAPVDLKVPDFKTPEAAAVPADSASSHDKGA